MKVYIIGVVRNPADAVDGEGMGVGIEPVDGGGMAPVEETGAGEPPGSIFRSGGRVAIRAAIVVATVLICVVFCCFCCDVIEFHSFASLVENALLMLVRA